MQLSKLIRMFISREEATRNYKSTNFIVICRVNLLI